MECGPLEARPITTSPATIALPSMIASFSTTPDREAREVVFAGRVHARHLGGLAADQRAAGLLAALGDALDHVGGDVDVELAAREVVEEEQRLGARTRMSLTLIATRSMPTVSWRFERERELELGAHAVGARDQHRLAKALADLDQRAEAADAAQHLGAHRALGERLDALDQRVAGVDVDAGVAVGEGCGDERTDTMR